jgi:hypothetical protein
MDAGKIFGIISLLAIVGMLLVPIVPHLRLRVETLGEKDKEKK